MAIDRRLYFLRPWRRGLKRGDLVPEEMITPDTVGVIATMRAAGIIGRKPEEMREPEAKVTTPERDKMVRADKVKRKATA
jgi:hypothetical protein